MSREAMLAAKREAVRQRRVHARANRLCVDCLAGLPEESRLVRCVECHETRAKSQRARMANPETAAKSRAVKARWAREKRKTDRDQRNAYERQRMLDKKLAGQCLCCQLDALEDSQFCATHKAIKNAASRNYMARRRSAEAIAWCAPC